MSLWVFEHGLHSISHKYNKESELVERSSACYNCNNSQATASNRNSITNPPVARGVSAHAPMVAVVAAVAAVAVAAAAAAAVAVAVAVTAAAAA